MSKSILRCAMIMGFMVLRRLGKNLSQSVRCLTTCAKLEHVTLTWVKCGEGAIPPIACICGTVTGQDGVLQQAQSKHNGIRIITLGVWMLEQGRIRSRRLEDTEKGILTLRLDVVVGRKGEVWQSGCQRTTLMAEVRKIVPVLTQLKDSIQRNWRCCVYEGLLCG